MCVCVCVCVCVRVRPCALTSPWGAVLCVLTQTVLQAHLLIKYDMIHISGLQYHYQALKRHGHIGRFALPSHLLETILKWMLRQQAPYWLPFICSRSLAWEEALTPQMTMLNVASSPCWVPKGDLEAPQVPFNFLHEWLLNRNGVGIILTSTFLGIHYANSVPHSPSHQA